MSDLFRRVQRGDRPSARQQNAIIGAAERILMGDTRGRAGAGAAIGDSVRIVVRNSTGETLPRYGVVALGDPVFDPDTAEGSFVNWKALEGIAPADVDCQPIAILQEPLKDGDIGSAVISGVSQVRLENLDDGHLFATHVVGATDRMVSTDAGPARILYRQADPEEGYPWALVQLGGPGTGCSGEPIQVVTCVSLRPATTEESPPPPPPPPPP